MAESVQFSIRGTGAPQHVPPRKSAPYIYTQKNRTPETKCNTQIDVVAWNLEIRRRVKMKINYNPNFMGMKKLTCEDYNYLAAVMDNGNIRFDCRFESNDDIFFNSMVLACLDALGVGYELGEGFISINGSIVYFNGNRQSIIDAVNRALSCDVNAVMDEWHMIAGVGSIRITIS